MDNKRPQPQHAEIMLGHGGGGKLMQRLLQNVVLPALASHHLQSPHDSAVIDLAHSKIAFTTDSYVVHPLFFPGGDIGKLAVYGTVNDLAMCAARPQYLSVGLIIEEGLATETLQKILQSMKAAADLANVELVTGDTKVVDRGKGDGVFINTAGIGIMEHSLSIHPQSISPGDAILVSGDIGRHGVAIMAEREGLEFETTLTSDCALLSSPVLSLLEAEVTIHCLRDLTRGGLGNNLVEVATSAGLSFWLEEDRIPVHPQVAGACEILGLDPWYIANEGRFVAFVPQSQAEQALAILHQHPICQEACQIGMVGASLPGTVVMKSPLGSERVIDMLSGEQLPRIC